MAFIIGVSRRVITCFTYKVIIGYFLKLLLFLRHKDYTYLSTIMIMCCKYCVHLTMTYTLLHTTHGFYAYIKSFCDDMMVWVIVLLKLLAHNLLKIFFNTFNSFPFCMFRFAFMTSSLPFFEKILLP